ncbi:MAG: DNA internalization-related competence protein ComEC/Rec2 [Longimicrobiales bacterium]
MSPITGFALAFAAGIAAGLRIAGPFLAIMTAALCTIALIHVRLRGDRRTQILIFGVIGLCAGTIHARRVRMDCRAMLPDGSRMTVTGVFEGRVAPDTTAFFRAEEIRLGAARFACVGVIRVRVARRVLRPVRGGTHVQMTGRWWAFPESGGWPVPPERTGTLSVTSLRTMQAGHRVHWLLAARVSAENRLRRQFGEQAGLAEALILARQGGLDQAVRSDFAAAGMAHVLAISGMHVGILAAILLLLARVLRLHASAAAIFAAAGTLAYVLFLGAPWAAARAALQAVLLLVSRLAQRPADAIGVLAATAMVLLAVDPLALLDAGFQLSFAGMWGIAWLRRPLLAALPERGPRSLREALVVSLAAMLATSPIAAMHFGQASIIGLVANLVASPVIAAAVPALALTLVTDMLHSGIAAEWAAGTGLLLTAMVTIAAQAARVPGGHFAVSSSGLVAALIAAMAFVLAGLFFRSDQDPRPARERARLRGRRLALQFAVAFGVWCTVPLFGGGGDGRVEIHAIDVGQGDAFAIRSPRGRWILVDAGPRSETFDAGRARVVPFLLRHGVRRIEALILTHPHADHIGGTEAVLEAFDVATVLDPSVPAGQEMYSDVLAAARRDGVRWYAGRAGREISLDGMTIRMLSPEDSLLDARGDPNDYSVVFHLGYGRFGALFLGDAPRSVENRIVARFGSGIASDVIKVGHHGSRTSTGDSLLLATHPRIALVAVGLRNRYGHPSPDVMTRLARNGVRVLRTDVNGSLVVRASADGLLEVRVAR